MLSYEKLARKPKLFRTFTGLTIEHGNALYIEIEQQYTLNRSGSDLEEKTGGGLSEQDESSSDQCKIGC